MAGSFHPMASMGFIRTALWLGKNKTTGPFSKKEASFNNMKAAFPHIKINHRNFDDEVFDFTFSAGSIKELRKKTETHSCNSKGLEELFKLLDPETQ